MLMVHEIGQRTDELQNVSIKLICPSLVFCHSREPGGKLTGEDTFCVPLRIMNSTFFINFLLSAPSRSERSNRFEDL